MEFIRCTFCGGSACKYEDYRQWTAPPNAIEGLYSNWITDQILAMQRPASQLIKEHNLIQVFKDQNIGAIVCLQEKGEHTLCGHGIEASSGLSYLPETFTDSGIQFIHYGWQDMSTPSLDLLFKIVQCITRILDTSQKISIHCHAGLGRTGLVIACVLVLRHGLTSDEAISLVRTKRPLSLQTKKQVLCVHAFEEERNHYMYAFFHVPRRRKAFNVTAEEVVIDDILDDPSSPQLVTLSEFLRRQRCILQATESQRLLYIPKIVYEICHRISHLATLHASVKLGVCEAFATFDGIKTPAEKLDFVGLKNQINHGSFEGVRNCNDHFLLIDTVLFWVLHLREPVISRSVQLSIEQSSQGEPAEPCHGLGRLNKITFHTINIILQVFRDIPDITSPLLSSITSKLATLITHKRSTLTHAFDPQFTSSPVSPGVSPSRRVRRLLPASPASSPTLAAIEDASTTTDMTAITNLLTYIYTTFGTSETTLRPILRHPDKPDSEKQVYATLGVEFPGHETNMDADIITEFDSYEAPIITSTLGLVKTSLPSLGVPNTSLDKINTAKHRTHSVQPSPVLTSPLSLPPIHNVVSENVLVRKSFDDAVVSVDGGVSEGRMSYDGVRGRKGNAVSPLGSPVPNGDGGENGSKWWMFAGNKKPQ
ncbi:hypothetical protein SmJEL517_g04503 [Synchytrium microbalum]|uniref:Protein-tyrosine-phosphatase n=1 Tax=Synchytrium microbalum TaxID=1806994 RepID=A0A507BYY2_9FUNG|nr:uncharacterized protein SmJEL517_g04503 [Synchytrium microbalum]TPX32328.1 hypothetical protein SmJEL517_g04503 [Synchytrium microbalum]